MSVEPLSSTVHALRPHLEPLFAAQINPDLPHRDPRNISQADEDDVRATAPQFSAFVL